jgi:hypothetical protein
MLLAQLGIEIDEPGVRRNPKGFQPNPECIASHYLLLTNPSAFNQLMAKHHRVNRQSISRQPLYETSFYR